MILFQYSESDFEEDFHSIPDGETHQSSSSSVRSKGEAKRPVFLDEIALSADENAGKEQTSMDNCGVMPGNCLPCISSTLPFVDKRSSSPPSARKKSALKLSFKWKEGNASAALCENQLLLFPNVISFQG